MKSYFKKIVNNIIIRLKKSSKIFWKTFFSFLLILLGTSISSTVIEKSILNKSSSDKIDKYIEELLEFKEKIKIELNENDLDGVTEILINNAKFYNQIYIYDEYNNEIFSRNYKRKIAKSDKGITAEFIKRNMPLEDWVLNYNNDYYYISIYPTIKYNYFFSPKKTAYILRILILILFSSVICYWLSNSISKRIIKLQKITKKIATGNMKLDFNEKPNVNSDEIDELTNSFYLMIKELNDNEINKRKMLSDISHELRSPLARIQTAAEIVRITPNNSEDMLSRIDLEIIKMDEMIEQIITIQKVELSTRGSSYSKFDIVELTANLINDVDFEFSNTNKSIEFISDNSEIIILANKNDIKSAIENVVRNAMFYTVENSLVTVKLELNANLVKISVTDQGKGIDAKDIEKVFEPFNRLDNSRTKDKKNKAKGYGLGLTITKAIIIAHNGSITLKNKEANSGLIVEITLPVNNKTTNNSNS